MIVTFISECEKKSLKRTRRILDAYANRIGNNAWQTNITEAGLKTVYELLKGNTKQGTASKNTAVACHRIATRHRTELLWVVGNKSKFDHAGRVAVNRTKRNLTHFEWENNWHFLDGMGIITTLAGLLHDIGKSSVGFQNKLANHAPLADPYRHEWVSLKLIAWLLQGCTSDDEVFDRLSQIDVYLASRPMPTPADFGEPIQANIGSLPPLTKWVIWLIVSHHRLPPIEAYFFKNPEEYSTPAYFARDVQTYLSQLQAVEGWVRSDKEKEKKRIEDFFRFDHLILHNALWQKQLKRYAQKAKNSPYLRTLAQHATTGAITDPFLLHLSRLALMSADHNYSSLIYGDKGKLVGKFDSTLIANTLTPTQIAKLSKHHGTDWQLANQPTAKQTLDEHLLGVARFASQMVRHLPTLHENLPTLQNHNPLLQNTNIERFLWQNTAFKTALKQREHADTHGFFGVNMASTGMGKTLANARIMYALSDPKKGARITVALGLRVLTLQTGQSFRKNLALSDKELAILVGGLAQKQLFNLQAKQDDQDQNELTDTGSESAERLLCEFVDSEMDLDLSELQLGTLLHDDTAHRLLASPMAVCTIDHLMQTSESKRGGRYIVPMLRLFGSDLILDEPDDFDQKDLPALSRLVHLAGLFGANILLSSATLPPDLVEGLFKAYQRGRAIYNANFGKPAPQVACVWFDEHGSEVVHVNEDFATPHRQFTQKRISHLQSAPIRHKGEIIPIEVRTDSEWEDDLYADLAGVMFDKAKALHETHHTLIDGKTVSVGLIRMANIKYLLKLAQAMHAKRKMAGFEDCQFYLACYHARQVLILRNQLERRLDKLLNRHNPNALADNVDILDNLAKHSDKKHHIFMVLATPVAEVGRDHDYDWAMIEPSSMRSIIQTAGRVWRHRTDKIAQTPNIAIWDKNIRTLLSKPVAFCYPGFESQKFNLATHQTSRLIRPHEYECISSVARIGKSTTLTPTQNLADLEHAVMADLMNNDSLNVVNGYYQQDTANRLHVHLSCLSPFRQSQKDSDYIINPLEGELSVHAYDSVETHGLAYATESEEVRPQPINCQNPNLDTWLTATLSEELDKLSAHYPDTPINTLIIRFCVASVSRYSNDKQTYHFDERFGVYEK